MPDKGMYKSKQEIEEDSPSRQAGISLADENHIRWCVATLLDAVSTQIDLQPSVFPKAMIYFQRFYLSRSLADEHYNAAYIALGCLFLAAKYAVEQKFKPTAGDIIQTALAILFQHRPEILQFFQEEENLQRFEDHVLDTEVELITGLQFKLSIRLPQDILRESIEKLRLPETDKQAMLELGMKFLADGLRTSVQVQYEPHVLGAAALFVALKRYKLIKDPIDECKAQVNEYNKALLARTHHGSPFWPMVGGESSPGPSPQFEKGEPSGTKESEDTAGDPDTEEYPSIEEEGLLRYILEDNEWTKPTAQTNQPQNLNVHVAVDEVHAPEDPPGNQEGVEALAPEDQPADQDMDEAQAPEDQPADQDGDEPQVPEDQPAVQDMDEVQAPEDQPADQDGDEPQVPENQPAVQDMDEVQAREDQPADQDGDEPQVPEDPSVDQEPHTPEIQYQGGDTAESPSGGAEYYLHEEDTTEFPTNAESAHQSVSPSDAQSDD